MRKAINGTLKILTISSVIVSMLLILVAFCTQYSIKEKSDLKSRTNILAQCLDGYDEDIEINILTKMYDNVSDIRVTLIKSDGTVIYDNEADTTTMENHFERPEVKQAVTYGNGSSSRNSETIGEKIYYYAVKLNNGSILRMSQPTKVIMYMVLTIMPIVIIILICIIAVSFVSAKHLTKYILDPINEVDINNIGKAEIYDELKPFFARIANQNAEKEKTEKIRREFTANVSHELKTPLHSISGYAELLKNGMVKDDDVAPFSKKIYSEAQRMIQLIDDIINLSHLDEGADDMKREDVDLYTLAENAVSSVENEAQNADVAIELTGETAVVNGISQLLFGMIYNLCDNAVKYNRAGGKVSVDVRNNEDSVILTVSDTGIGIPEEHKERVFERFYRVNKSHSKEVGGTGLGLSIVKHSAMIHNAKITLNSVLNEGTTITVVFPKNN